MTCRPVDDITTDKPYGTLADRRQEARQGAAQLRAFADAFAARRRQAPLRDIDFKRDKQGIPAKVAAIEYDPNRSARIALLNYADGEKRYILRRLG